MALLALAAMVGLTAPLAHASDEVASYVVQADIAADGVLTVNATITPDRAGAELRQRFATSVTTARDLRYQFTIGDVRATVGGRPAQAQVTTDGDYQVVTVPLSGDEPVGLSYTVRGAAIDNGDGTTTVAWRLLQGLNLPVRTFDATVKVPGLFTMIDCRAGSPAAPGVCADFSGGVHGQQDPVFHDGPRGVGEVVQVVLRFSDRVVAPNAQVSRVWTLDHAFSAGPLPLGVALGVGLLGLAAFALLHRAFGRDGGPVAASPTMVGGFRPVGDGQSEFAMDADIRPGQVGTLVDERVDPVDVTATVLDLAVRGHLLITELPRAGAFKPTEWTLTRREGRDALRAYEARLLDALGGDGGDGARSVVLSQALPALAEASGEVQDELYADVVRHGWFAVRPDSTRTKWVRLGWLVIAVAVVAAGLLIAFTEFGLLGLVLVALAVGVGFVGQAMPARTIKGASVLQGLGVLRGQLLTQPTDQMPRGREYQELSEVLPYAVVLGGVDRWLDGLAATDTDGVPDPTDLDWYHGPDDWQLADLPDSLRNFVQTTEGGLLKR